MKIVGMLVILIITFGYTQIPDTLWTKTYGGPEDDWASAVVQTSDGGYIIVGTTHSFGAGQSDIWLLKTDTNGDTLWTRTYGGNWNPIGSDVQQTSDGGYIIGGGGIPAGMAISGWLIRTDSIGDTLWTKICLEGDGCVNSVRLTSDGGYIAVGSVGDPRWSYATLSRRDSLGNEIWTQGYAHGGPGSGAQSVLQTADGGYIAAGDDMGRFYYFKTDSLGSTCWFDIFGTGYARSIRRTPDGELILAGCTGSEWLGEADLCLVRCDSTGNSFGMWAHGGPSNDVGNSVDITADGYYIIVGYTESFGAGNSDVYLLKTDARPINPATTTMTYGGAADDVGNSVQRTADGGYIIAGYTESFGAGGRDVYLIKTAPDIGIEENKSAVVTNKGIRATIFRGPLQLPEDKNCKVFDITGRFVEPDKIQPGIYFIEIDGVVTQKVVKVR